MCVLFLSCANDGNSDSQLKIKPVSRPQVIDVLKDKSKAEILKMKYHELKATCNLVAIKATQDQIASFSTELTPPSVPPSENPVKNPTEGSLTFDLKLQQLVDKELAQDVKSTVTISLDRKTLIAEVTFKPVVFQEFVNLEINKKKYIMKHSPVLSYSVIYELKQDGSPTFASSQAKIYEKIEDQKNTLVGIKIGEQRYNFVLDCQLDRVINAENNNLAAEFESQWAVIDCLSPPSDTERRACAP